MKAWQRMQWIKLKDEFIESCTMECNSPSAVVCYERKTHLLDGVENSLIFVYILVHWKKL